MKNRSVAPYILLAAFAVLLTALILVGYTIGNELKLQNQKITSLHEELIRLESLESEIELMQTMLEEHDFNWEKALTRLKRIEEDIDTLRKTTATMDEDQDALFLHLTSLENEIAVLKSMIRKLNVTGGSTDSDVGSASEFRYFAIGNSITWHCKCEYWWNEVGMAASQKGKDYVALVAADLKERYDVVSYEALNFAIWETNAHDRSQTLSTLDPYLSADLDLITIQLSENASNLATFERDYEALILYVREKCPNAEIVLVDEFWQANKSVMKKRVAEKLNMPYADLSEIQNDPAYQSSMGQIVYGDDGVKHAVDHAGVAGHPGDKGMRYIADAIIKVMES